MDMKNFFDFFGCVVLVIGVFCGIGEGIVRLLVV